MENNENFNTDEKNFMTYVNEAIGHAPLIVKVKKLDPRAVIPTYAHEGDVGMDLTAISMEYDKDNDMYVYHTGLAIESDFHFGTFLFPRSSNRRTEAYLCNHVGIADSAIYRGEIILCFKNRDSLRQLARESEMVEFMNRIKKGDSVLEASLSAGAIFSEVLANEDTAMSLAPYKVGERIAQMVVLGYPNVKIMEVEELSDTERGDKGFGSSGK